MKKLLIPFLLLLGTLSYGQKKDSIVVKFDTDSIRDEEVYVYKCVDKITKQTVYLDLLDRGSIGFMLNKTLIIYSAASYVLATTSNDTLWQKDSISIFLLPKMPIDAIIFNTQETKVSIYFSMSNGKLMISELTIVDKLKGFRQAIYERRRKRLPRFEYGKTIVPPYVKFNKE